MRASAGCPTTLVNKIAAGEVVERPASAVKELVENALDAGAARVTVDLRDGGAALIRVTDDGVGMTAEELPLALERHATSKLARDEDLDAIATLGFRGEALAAICAVSRFTRHEPARAEPPRGCAWPARAASSSQQLAVPGRTGHDASRCSDLFFNTPARLKFLKTPRPSWRRACAPLTQLALAHPDVQLRVTNNGRAVLTAPARRRPAPARRRALGLGDRRAAAGRRPRASTGVAVAGWSSPPDLTRGNRDEIVLIVNGRPVRDPALLQAVLDAYRPAAAARPLPAGRARARRCRRPTWTSTSIRPRPGCASASPAWSRRCSSPRCARRCAGRPWCAHGGLGAAAAGGADPSPATAPSPRRRRRRRGRAAAALFEEPAAPYAGQPLRPRARPGPGHVHRLDDRGGGVLPRPARGARAGALRAPAARARGGAARRRRRCSSPSRSSWPPAARALLERWREPLERLGFAFEGFGGDAVVLRAVPALLKGDEPKRLIEAAVDELARPQARRRRAARPRAGLRGLPGGDQGQHAARARGDGAASSPTSSRTATPYFCPHGRPIVSRVSLHDIRRELKRTW